MPVIEVNNLSVRYGDEDAVRSVNFDVEAGEVVALLGPNGAGKTTTLETIQGYHSPTAGSVSVFGLDPTSARRTLAKRWGVMPQAGGIPMGLTVGEAIRLFSDLHGYAGDREALASLVGLGSLSKRRWRRLSGGEQQRLSLALALCGGRDLLMLDEPTAAVDAHGREQILQVIGERAKAGAGVLVTTHRFDDVEAVADKVVILNHGTVVSAGSLEELTEGVSEIRFTGPVGLDVSELSEALQFCVIEIRPGSYLAQAPPDPVNVAAITTWLASRNHTIGQLQAGRRKLEDVFNELTRASTGRDKTDKQPATSDDQTGHNYKTRDNTTRDGDQSAGTAR